MLRKLADVQWNIAAPRYSFNDTWLEEYYASLSLLEGDSYVVMKLKLQQFNNRAPNFECLRPGKCPPPAEDKEKRDFPTQFIVLRVIPSTSKLGLACSAMPAAADSGQRVVQPGGQLRQHTSRHAPALLSPLQCV